MECEEWFHFACIGYHGNQGEADTFDFCCNECNFDGQQRIANAKIYAKLFDFSQATYETYLRPKDFSKNSDKNRHSEMEM